MRQQKGILVLDNPNSKEILNNQMQSNFYPKNVGSSPSLTIRSNQSPILPAFDEEQCSNNPLNDAFICESQNLNLSESSSMSQMSVSGISVIHKNPKDSPQFVSNLKEDIGMLSGMEEWPSPQLPFAKRNLKRNKPQIFEDELEELALEKQCTKKKMGDKNKILTINACLKAPQQRIYQTRSKGKYGMDDESSSNDEIREFINAIGREGKCVNPQKVKLGSK